MMNGALHLNKRTVNCVWSGFGLICQRRRWPPRVRLPTDNGESRISNVEATILVHDLNIRWGGDVEGIATDDTQILEIDRARDQRELIARHATASLQVTISFIRVLVDSCKQGFIFWGRTYSVQYWYGQLLHC